MKNSKTIIIITSILALSVIAAIITVINVTISGEGSGKLGESFNYDLNEFYKTDPAIVKYIELRKINSGLNNASAIAIDQNDHIYIAGDNLIRIFNDNGSKLFEIKLSNSPNCLTVTNDGDIYVGIKNRIEVYNKSGKLISKWKELDESSLITSVVSYKDNIFIADAGKRIVVRYSKDGNIIGYIGKKDIEKDILGFVIPSPHFDMAITPEGLISVINPGRHKIETYTIDGKIISAWGDPGMDVKNFSGCSNPVGLAVLSDGRFVTCEKGIPRIKVYRDDGTFESVVASAEVFAKTVGVYNPAKDAEDTTKALDIAVDSMDRILVLDPVESSIRIYARK